jgi:hypothetical protein
MKVELEVPEIRGGVMKFPWENGFTIKSEQLSDGSVVIDGNPAGLISLARHLLALAQPGVSDGYHFHLDDSNGGLDDGSIHLIFGRRDTPSSGPAPTVTLDTDRT